MPLVASTTPGDHDLRILSSQDRLDLKNRVLAYYIKSHERRASACSLVRVRRHARFPRPETRELHCLSVRRRGGRDETGGGDVGG